MFGPGGLTTVKCPTAAQDGETTDFMPLHGGLADQSASTNGLRRPDEHTSAPCTPRDESK